MVSRCLPPTVLVFICSAIGSVVALPARADILQATLVEDTYVRSGASGTNFNGDSDLGFEIFVRNAGSTSSYNRLGLVQFVLPQLPSGIVASDVIAAELAGTIAHNKTTNPDLYVLGLSVNPDLTKVTYDDLLDTSGNGVITGIDGSSYDFIYGNNATVFDDLWEIDANVDEVDKRVTYEDELASGGLLSFIRDNISTTESKTITLALGPHGTTDFQFYSQETMPAMSLKLTTVPEPSSMVLAALGVLLGLVAIYRRWW